MKINSSSYQKPEEGNNNILFIKDNNDNDNDNENDE